MWDILNVLNAYSISAKVVDILKIFYNDYKCAVLHNDQLSEWFSVMVID